jgi:hypothetical protein
MEWTIEKVRELPEDNWLGIKRVGPHAWRIGNEGKKDEMVLYTGDGGVLEYLKAFDKATMEPIGLIEIFKKASERPVTYLPGTITEKDLKKLIQELLFRDGMDKT